MEGLIDLIIGSFIAFLPVFLLLLRRRRRNARAAARRAMMDQQEESEDGQSEAVEPAPPGEPQKDPGPAAVYHRSVAATAASSAAAQRQGYVQSQAPQRRASKTGEPAESAEEEPLKVGSSAEGSRTALGRAAVWRRIDALPPGQRAIVLSEIISKPVALRRDSSWL